MSRSHGHRFANEALPEALFDNPLVFARTLATGRYGLQLIASAWDRAGALLPAADRAGRSGLTATLEQRGPFATIQITVPPPRETGDPAAIVIVGRGDGVTAFDDAQYFMLELGDARFHVVSRTAHDEHGTNLGMGPAPDMRWFTDHVCELIAKRPPPPARAPSVPAWYWWHVFRGADAMRSFFGANDRAAQLHAAQRAPILLLPEIVEAADVFLTGGATAAPLRDFQAALKADASYAPALHVLATLLANARIGSVAANLCRAITIIDQAREYGADESQSSAIEADVRQKLAAIGIEPRANYEAAQRLLARAQAPTTDDPVQPGWTSPQRRIARGSIAASAGDPTWTALFLDETELVHYRRTDDRRFEAPPSGALHAGSSTWIGDERWPMWHLIDTRMLFATAEAADRYLRSVLATIGDGLPALPTAELADATIAFGHPGAQSIVIRVGRMVAKLYVVEGPAARASGHALDQSMLLPLAQRITQRAQWLLARYWLSIGRSTDAATLFARSPTPRLFADYPILALPELPAAMLTLGSEYIAAAQALWDLQTKLRSREWQTHRQAMAALVRTLLDEQAGEPRVNVAHATALVAEMRRLDADPVWATLEAECRACAPLLLAALLDLGHHRRDVLLVDLVEHRLLERRVLFHGQELLLAAHVVLLGDRRVEQHREVVRLLNGRPCRAYGALRNFHRVTLATPSRSFAVIGLPVSSFSSVGSIDFSVAGSIIRKCDRPAAWMLRNAVIAPWHFVWQQSSDLQSMNRDWRSSSSLYTELPDPRCGE